MLNFRSLLYTQFQMNPLRPYAANFTLNTVLMQLMQATFLHISYLISDVYIKNNYLYFTFAFRLASNYSFKAHFEKKNSNSKYQKKEIKCHKKSESFNRLALNREIVYFYLCL